MRFLDVKRVPKLSQLKFCSSNELTYENSLQRPGTAADFGDDLSHDLEVQSDQI